MEKTIEDKRFAAGMKVRAKKLAREIGPIKRVHLIQGDRSDAFLEAFNKSLAKQRLSKVN